jgi:hypothetical protein
MVGEESKPPRMGGTITLKDLMEILEEEGFDFETMDVLQSGYGAKSPEAQAQPSRRKPGQVPPFKGKPSSLRLQQEVPNEANKLQGPPEDEDPSSTT